MSIKQLTEMVEKKCNCKVTWELGKTYEAFNLETYERVATYNPRTGKLVITRRQ